MTQLREREQFRITPLPLRTNHALEWVLSILGVAVGVTGGYLYFANPLRTIHVLGWESQVGDVAAGWGYGLQIAGALLLVGCFAFFARKVFNRHGAWNVAVWTGAILATAALLYGLTFAALWIVWAF
jgi:hypothetical protein